MKIENYCRFIDIHPLHELIALLPDPIQELDIFIYIFSNISQAKKIINFPFIPESYWDSVREGILHGTSWENPRCISIYTFNFFHPNTTNMQLQLIFTLFHELRHHYQMDYLKELTDVSSHPVSPSQLPPAEQDANWYAAQWMEKFHSQITDILSLPTSKWHVGIPQDSKPFD